MEWISVKDDLPKDYSKYWIWDGIIVTTGWFDGDRWYYDDNDDNEPAEIRNWGEYLIPEPPKEDK